MSGCRRFIRRLYNIRSLSRSEANYMLPGHRFVPHPKKSSRKGTIRATILSSHFTNISESERPRSFAEPGTKPGKPRLYRPCVCKASDCPKPFIIPGTKNPWPFPAETRPPAPKPPKDRTSALPEQALLPPSIWKTVTPDLVKLSPNHLQTNSFFIP